MPFKEEGNEFCHKAGMTRRFAYTLAAAAVVLLGAAPAHGQSDSAKRMTVTPGAKYEAGGFESFFLGSGWRELWTTPVSAPVFSPDALGLKFDKRGGGRQSITVHFKEKGGWKGYVWRSVDKVPVDNLSPEFEGTFVGRLIQDQTSAFLPAAPLLVTPLLQSIGVLHLEPTLYVMGDNKSLGALNDTVSGMLGTFELKPTEADDDQPGFAGSAKIEGTSDFFEELSKDHNQTFDEREFLKSRLIDFLINDTDRSTDNYEFARFGDKAKGYRWRAIPRDRDWAFINAGGIMNRLVVRSIFAKLQPMGHKYEYSGLVYTSHILDRRLLQRLTAKDFREVAYEVKQAVTDPVLARVVGLLPSEWQKTSAPEELMSKLKSRRDRLPDVAMKFYRDLASEPDLHGTVMADRVEIIRHSNGDVTVRINALQPEMLARVERLKNGTVITEQPGEVAVAGEDWYERTFTPGETKEIRIYMGKGDDLVTIGGSPNRAILIRVIGEEGNDTFADVIGGKATRFYDQYGDNAVLAGPRIDLRKWEAPVPREGMRLGMLWRPDWGGKRGWSFTGGHNTGAGIIIGTGPRFTDYGFRKLPFAMKGGANFLYGTANGRVGVNGFIDSRFENSPMGWTLDARATQLESFRFFGYGNDTPDIGSRLSLVEQRAVIVDPALVYRIGWRARDNGFNEIRGAKGNAAEGEDTTGLVRRLRPTVGTLTAGPTLSWFKPEPDLGEPIVAANPTGSESYMIAGLKLGLQVDRTDDDAMPTSGYTFRASASAYPPMLGIDDAFGTLAGQATGYIPFLSGGPHLAFRAGGALGMGDVPIQFAPAIGGRNSLRGFASRRFTGDASANAGAELRIPVGTMNFLIKSKLGIFGLTDVARVWYDGANEGGWHQSYGGGIWASALGKSLSVAYAQGEAGRLYLRLGQSY